METQVKNSNLNKAKKEKNDEFYTQYHDIEKEMNAYLEYNANSFRGKTVYSLATIQNGVTLPNISPKILPV